MPANLPEQLLPDLLLALHDAAPGLRVQTVGQSSATQVAALHSRELDAGLVRQDPGGEGLAGWLVHRERVGVALPAGHRLAQAVAVSAAQLSQLELITAPPAMMPGFHADLVRALTAAGWRGELRESPDSEATLDLVAAGLGAAPMLCTTAIRHAGGRSGRLVWRPFDDVAVDSRLWCAWHPQRRSAAVDTLLGALTESRSAPGSPTDKDGLSGHVTGVLDGEGAHGLARDAYDLIEEPP